MIDKHQLSELVTETLKEMDLYAVAARNLVLGTIAQESASGRYLKQLGNGPAKGIVQMEPFTHDDYWNNFIGYREKIGDYLLSITSTRTENRPDASELTWNLKYAIAMCRVFYLRKPGALPKDLKGMAAYWKKHYNTHLGAGTVEEFELNYAKHVT